MSETEKKQTFNTFCTDAAIFTQVHLCRKEIRPTTARMDLFQKFILKAVNQRVFVCILGEGYYLELKRSKSATVKKCLARRPQPACRALWSFDNPENAKLLMEVYIIDPDHITKMTAMNIHSREIKTLHQKFGI